VTLALGPQANIAVPHYRTGCKPGHRPLEFRRGECFKCGREEPPIFQLPPEELAKAARRRDLKRRGPELLLDAIFQTRLKMRALAFLEDIDIDNAEAFERWGKRQIGRREGVDYLLAQYEEDEVRFAFKAAYT